MGNHARLTVLAVVMAVVAACTSQGGPSTAVPVRTIAPEPSAALLATPNPCLFAITRLGAFAEELAGELAALRPLVVAARFDAAKTASGARQVSATLTTYEGLESDLQRCEPVAGLSARVAALRKSAETTLNVLLSTPSSEPQKHRDSAVTLFGLLPEVLALSKAAKTAGDNLGFQVALATVPAGADKPLGSLAPLATPIPVAKATSRPTPRATPRPTTRPRPSSQPPQSGGGVAWQTAQLYLAGVQATYTGSYGFYPTPTSWTICSDPSLNGEERAVCDGALNGKGAALARFDAHRAWMTKHPMACLNDAYASDRSLMNYLQNVLIVGWLAAGTDPTKLQQRMDAFFGKLSAYVSDCH
jgi:uncharacterized membrane protein